MKKLRNRIVSFILSIIIFFLQIFTSFASVTVATVAGISAFAGLLATAGVYCAKDTDFSKLYEKACELNETWRAPFRLFALGYCAITKAQYDAFVDSLTSTGLFGYKDIMVEEDLEFITTPGTNTIFTEYGRNHVFVAKGDCFTFQFIKGQATDDELVQLGRLFQNPVTINVAKQYDYMHVSSHDLVADFINTPIQESVANGGQLSVTFGEIPRYFDQDHYRRRIGALAEFIYEEGAGLHRKFWDIGSYFEGGIIYPHVVVRPFGKFKDRYKLRDGVLVETPMFADYPHVNVPAADLSDVMLVPPIPEAYINKDRELLFFPYPTRDIPVFNPSLDLPSKVVKNVIDVPWDFPFGIEGAETDYPDVIVVPNNSDVPADPPIDEPIVPPAPLDLGWLKDLIGKILEILRKIIEAIKSIPGLLNDILSSLKAIPLAIMTELAKFFDVSQFSLNFDKFKLVNIDSKFPFCIPFDLLRVVKALSASPKEPEFKISFNNQFIKYDYVVSLSAIKTPIAFFRAFCVISFSFFLILKTKSLIKW